MTMKLETIIYEKDGEIAWFKLNRPQVLNAENFQLCRELVMALDEAWRDLGVKVVILKGEGRAFCAGADIKEASIPKTDEQRLLHFRASADVGRGMKALGKPIIAAVHGYCLGAGLEYALACDIRIAAENAQFGFPEASIGAPITTAGLQNLPQLVGLARAKELVYTSKMIDAREAERIGLVNRVVPLDELDKSALELAKEICKNSSAAIKLMKGIMDHSFELSKEAVYFLDGVYSEVLSISGIAATGFTAKKEEMAKKKR
jgi:enoyl-CoA hydratase